MAFDLSGYTGSYALDSWTLRSIPYRDRAAARAKRSAFLAKAKEEKARLSRTCQICDRPIFAESGVIAHHGYERPGYGWQTASCYGARRLPWEKSCDAVADYIEIIKRDVANLDAYHTALQQRRAEPRAVVRVRTNKRGASHTVNRECAVTAESLPVLAFLVEMTKNNRDIYRNEYFTLESDDFESVLRAAMNRTAQQLAEARAALAHYTAKKESWAAVE